MSLGEKSLQNRLFEPRITYRFVRLGQLVVIFSGKPGEKKNIDKKAPTGLGTTGQWGTMTVLRLAYGQMSNELSF